MGNSPSKPGGSSERFILENPEFSRQNEPTIDVKVKPSVVLLPAVDSHCME